MTADQATDRPIDSPADVPVDAPVEVVADVSTDTPLDGSTDSPADSPADVPVDAPVEVVADVSTDTPLDGSTDAAVDSPADSPADKSGDGAGDRPPNIVFVLADDLDMGVYGRMDRLHAMMDAQGTVFANHFLNVSLCCPSRAAILRGQYAHNTNIFGNAPPQGGFETFFADKSESSTVATWLKAAGYRTVLVGKYLNGYPATAPAAYIPPGWTEWFSPVAGKPYTEYGYTLNENGKLVVYGAAPSDYLVDVIARKGADFIKRTAAEPARPPFFMFVTPYKPHTPATPPPRYLTAFPGAMAPRTPAFNEADVSDKPPWVSDLPPLSAIEIGEIDDLYRKRLQSMMAVEDLVQTLIDSLKTAGELDRTYIVFTSDNGFHQGQHRLASGKNTGFDEDLFAPLVVRGPGVPAGRVVDATTVNIDFAPTFLELAGVAIPDLVDGRSLAPLLRDTPPPTVWRQGFLLEHRGLDETPIVVPSPARRRIAGTLEPPDPFDLQQVPTLEATARAPVFVGVRTAGHTYVEYETGEKELYDHVADPNQLSNIASKADPSLLAKLKARIEALRGCKGGACRAAEEAP